MITCEAFISDWILIRNPHRKLDKDMDLFDAGFLDSLSFNELLASVEARHEKVIDFDSIQDWRTIRTYNGLVRFLCES